MAVSGVARFTGNAHVSRFKGRAESVGYIVEEGCRPAKPCG